MKRRIETAQRRARLAQRHRLAAEARAKDPVAVADSVVALHSTDPSSVYLAALVRMTGGDIGTVERTLYEDRTLIRLLGMRRTVFVASLDVAPLIQAACSRGVAAKERRKLIGMLTESGVGKDKDVEGWLDAAAEAALRALAARGEATAAELATDDPRLRTQVVLAKGKSYEGRQNVSSRLMLLLAAEGKVVRGRPRGSWMSHQYSWVPITTWTPDGLDRWATPEAEVELARRWLASYGPATPEDLQWWTGWTKTQVKRVLAELRPAEVELDGAAGIALPDDLDSMTPPAPSAALLPAFDPVLMGWQQRQWFLGEHGPKLFDRAGNAGPSLWWDGRIVGGWAQDGNGDIVCRFLEDVGSDATAAVEAQAARMTELLGGSRLSARTRGKTWLEEELT
jgi:winged helix DNA-binding protein